VNDVLKDVMQKCIFRDPFRWVERGKARSARRPVKSHDGVVHRART
jgi:hypothetical protein